MEEIPSLPLDFEEPQKAPSHAYSKDSITQDLRWVGSLGSRTGKAPGRSGWDEGEETGSPWAHLQPREGSECWKPRGAWFKGIPSGSIVKNLPANAGDTRDMGLIPGSGRFPGGGHGNPFQYSCLENYMNGEAWLSTVHGVAKILAENPVG